MGLQSVRRRWLVAAATCLISWAGANPDNSEVWYLIDIPAIVCHASRDGMDAYESTSSGDGTVKFEISVNTRDEAAFIPHVITLYRTSGTPVKVTFKVDDGTAAPVETTSVDLAEVANTTTAPLLAVDAALDAELDRALFNLRDVVQEDVVPTILAPSSRSRSSPTYSPPRRRAPTYSPPRRRAPTYSSPRSRTSYSSPRSRSSYSSPRSRTYYSPEMGFRRRYIPAGMPSRRRAAATQGYGGSRYFNPGRPNTGAYGYTRPPPYTAVPHPYGYSGYQAYKPPVAGMSTNKKILLGTAAGVGLGAAGGYYVGSRYHTYGYRPGRSYTHFSGRLCYYGSSGSSMDCGQCYRFYPDCRADFSPPEAANRDDLMKTGFVPSDSKTDKIIVTITGIEGGEYLKEKLCPPKGWKMVINDTNTTNCSTNGTNGTNCTNGNNNTNGTIGDNTTNGTIGDNTTNGTIGDNTSNGSEIRRLAGSEAPTWEPPVLDMYLTMTPVEELEDEEGVDDGGGAGGVGGGVGGGAVAGIVVAVLCCGGLCCAGLMCSGKTTGGGPAREVELGQLPAPSEQLPPYGAPGYGDPPYGGPPYGAPPYGAPPYGAPPVYGEPQYGAPPAYGQPQYGAPPAYGQPQYGAPPAYGEPQYGAPPAFGGPYGS